MIKQTYSIGNIDYTLTRFTGKFALYAGRHQKTKRRICYELVMLPNTGNPNLPQEERILYLFLLFLRVIGVSRVGRLLT